MLMIVPVVMQRLGHVIHDYSFVTNVSAHARQYRSENLFIQQHESPFWEAIYTAGVLSTGFYGLPMEYMGELYSVSGTPLLLMLR